MPIFKRDEKVEFLATQCVDYDRYAGCLYFLERVDVDGKYGLVCGEQSDEHGTHEKVLLPPLYNEIKVTKISSRKAIYDKYRVVADGDQIGQFTLGLNAWVPMAYFTKNEIFGRGMPQAGKPRLK
jgi:hypothetical protein